MLIQEDVVDVTTATGPMRIHRYYPVQGGPFPAIILFSEIYQITGPIERTAKRLASQGFIIAAPEVYHEFEPLGSVFAYDKEGTDKGNRYKIEKEVSAFDTDAQAVITHLLSLNLCNGKLGAIGICLGGHLSFRCAMNKEILASACLYPTDIHKGSLGKGMADNTLKRIPEIKGELLMVFGKQDPHIPPTGRELIYQSMTKAEIKFTWHEFHAQHAFIRDEGPRYDAALADIGFALVLEMFNRCLQFGYLETINGATSPQIMQNPS